MNYTFSPGKTVLIFNVRILSTQKPLINIEHFYNHSRINVILLKGKNGDDRKIFYEVEVTEEEKK